MQGKRRRAPAKGKGSGPRAAPPVERDDVRALVNRCPFCHEDVSAAQEGWLACAGCLARHHVACWREARRCSLCGSRRALHRRVQSKASARPRDLPVLGFGLAALLGLVFLVALAQRTPVADRQAPRVAEADRLEAERRELEQARRTAEELARESALARMAAADYVQLSEESERAWDARREADRREKATREAARALEKEVRALVGEGSLLLREGEEAKAFDQFARALVLCPDHPVALANRALIELRRGEYAAAIADCGRALASRPDLVNALVTRGSARRLRGDRQGALEDFSLAVAKDPFHVSALNNRGVTRSLEGDLEGALVDYDTALSCAPANAEIYLNRAAARERFGDAKGAFDDYRIFLHLAPDDDNAARAREGRDRLEQVVLASLRQQAEANLDRGREQTQQTSPLR